MSPTAHVISGVLLLIVITVMFGGFSLLWLLPRDRLSAEQVSSFRAGHAHAGVLLILTLVVVDLADRAGASESTLWMTAAALFIFALAQSGGFFIALGNRRLGRIVTTVGAAGLAIAVATAAVWLLSRG